MLAFQTIVHQLTKFQNSLFIASAKSSLDIALIQSLISFISTISLSNLHVVSLSNVNLLSIFMYNSALSGNELNVFISIHSISDNVVCTLFTYSSSTTSEENQSIFQK